MNSRERFRETMGYGNPDRVPYFEEGIRDTVMQVWHQQGLRPQTDLTSLFPVDQRREIELDLSPRPVFKKWPASMRELKPLRQRLDPDDPCRLPGDWQDIVHTASTQNAVRMLRIHRGFFVSMGVEGWDRFREVMLLLTDEPEFVRQYMLTQGEFAAAMADRVLRQVEIEAVIFSEPIGGNDRPLISPRMYEELVIKSYRPILSVLNRHGIRTIILRTYANARLLIPCFLKYGFNCLWACEVNIAAMDYRNLRKEFGRDLRFIGGIDLDALRHGKAAIKQELEEKVPPLITAGGYVPMADGRVREDVSFESYRYYRKLLQKITMA